MAPVILFASPGDRVIDWSRVRDVHLDTRLLLQALHHPSISIVEAAAELLAGGAWHRELIVQLTDLLGSGDEWVMNASAFVLSNALLPEEAVGVLATRLDAPAPATHAYIYGCLADLYATVGDDEQRAIRDRLYAGILSANSIAAHGAAQALLRLKLPSENRDIEIQRAFEHWKTAEHQCGRCGRPISVDKTSCSSSQCGSVPYTPLVRSCSS